MDGSELAFIEVRAFPWRLRTRLMKVRGLREAMDPLDAIGAIDDPSGIVFGIALLLIAAPLIVVVLAALVFSFELPLLVVLALLLVVARLVGAIPWTVGVFDKRTGLIRRERTRSLVRAIQRVRRINGRGRVRVRWSWG